MKAISVLIISGSLLFSALGEAGQGRHHDEHFLLSDKAASTLNLSKEQQQKIASIIERKKVAMKDLKAMRHNHKGEFKALVENDYFDEQQARVLIAKTSDAKQQALLAKLKSKQQIWQVLTPEQRAKLEKIKHRKAHRHTK
ncbi:Spy/CpxP family protein refolding chaperone [Pseudoalteromonas sp. JBTF-M23]|uniref:Spy/CpxP family protein refolding chaperone n=1 Tax=Pseudoalteromonas caenipelagi TaxID=2726988 RepID=A0A849VFN2_9GAMM|nr:Spy/CpxP family protein refolding chaperone [Pseudoalteromonas caenipelagi]NOU51610.1 Spy/CpxP family protein refolding chaperone [Pseudoalteromonas caenipelagi]